MNQSCRTVFAQSTETGNGRGRTQRLPFLDVIRGITLISMILYHASWDAVYLVGADWPWYSGVRGFVWQQSICWTFILLSGFCIPFSHRLLRRGLTVFGAGALVTLVTVLVLPEDRVVFGVLTLLGSCMLFMIPLRRIFDRGRDIQEQDLQDSPGGSQRFCEEMRHSSRKEQDFRVERQDSRRKKQDSRGERQDSRGERQAFHGERLDFRGERPTWCSPAKSEQGSGKAAAGFLVSAVLFLFLRHINNGFVGFWLLGQIIPGFPAAAAQIRLPSFLYQNLLTAYLGFPPPDFYSTDYFAVLPWGLLYLCGYFLCLICREKGWLDMALFRLNIRPLAWIGRHSLLIYLMHQPVLYAVILLMQ